MDGTVLVVDDDPDIRDLYRRALGTQGFVVLEANDLAEARASLVSNEVDALVLDLELGEGDTTPLLEMLSRRSQAPPVVLATTSPRGARVAKRFHVPNLEKLELGTLADKLQQAIDEGKRPRVSVEQTRVSHTSSRG